MGEGQETFEKLKELMPEGWEEKAKELEALRRARGITNAGELLLLNLVYLTEGKSFGGTAALLRAGGRLHLNKNAVYKRIRGSKKWLEWLCKNIYRRGGVLSEKPAWLAGKRVVIVDGTEEPVYGSKESNYRLHYCIDMFTLAMKEMKLTDTKRGEKLSNFETVGKEDVVVADRGYCSRQGIEYLRERGSGFVVRMRSNAFKLYNKSHKEIKLEGFFRKLSGGESGSVTVFYRVGGEYKPLRICAVRKSREAQMRGLEQIKKSNNKKMRGKVSSLQELYNRYIVVATSFGDETRAQGVLELYRMRWQIELTFKRLKTLFNYNEIPSKLDDSACSWFYGKLLLAAVCEAFVNKGRFSPCEAACQRMEPLEGTERNAFAGRVYGIKRNQFF